MFVLFMVVAMLFSTQMTDPVFAADRSLNAVYGIGAGYYYLYPKDSQIKDYYRGAPNYRVFADLKADSGISLAGEVGYYTENNHSNSAPAGTYLSLIPVTVSAAYHLFKDSAFSPYFGGGFGIFLINESDPDFNYLKTSKFGKFIFLGADLFYTPDNLIRAELRQTFIDPVNSTLYYQANFGGLSATISVAVEVPLFGKEADMSPEERILAQQERKYSAEVLARLNRLREMELYYEQKEWDEKLFQRWKSREVLMNEINQVKAKIEEEKAKTEELKKEREEKRRLYLEEKEKKRQQKKESAISPQQNQNNEPKTN